MFDCRCYIEIERLLAHLNSLPFGLRDNDRTAVSICNSAQPSKVARDTSDVSEGYLKSCNVRHLVIVCADSVVCIIYKVKFTYSFSYDIFERVKCQKNVH